MGDSTEFARKLITPYAERIEELEEEVERLRECLSDDAEYARILMGEMGAIVRCGECRHRFTGYDPDYDVHLSACDRFDISRVEAEDYCAWGERGIEVGR